jgi:hypothetical protein
MKREHVRVVAVAAAERRQNTPGIVQLPGFGVFTLIL